MSLQQRLSQIRTSSSDPLDLLHTFETADDARLEADLHRRFSSQRVSGEWFNFSSDVRNYLQELSVDIPAYQPDDYTSAKDRRTLAERTQATHGRPGRPWYKIIAECDKRTEMIIFRVSPAEKEALRHLLGTSKLGSAARDIVLEQACRLPDTK